MSSCWLGVLGRGRVLGDRCELPRCAPSCAEEWFPGHGERPGLWGGHLACPASLEEGGIRGLFDLSVEEPGMLFSKGYFKTQRNEAAQY